MTPHEQSAYEKAMKLAVASGLRCAMGPAFLAQSEKSKHRGLIALAAIGELGFDKIPGVPSRRSLALLIPRAISGAYSAHKMIQAQGLNDPLAAPMGAVVAAGTATVAPIVRGVLRRVLGLPDIYIGLAEDYLALKLGSEAVGMSWSDVKNVGEEAVTELKEAVLPAEAEHGHLQSTGFSASSI